MSTDETPKIHVDSDWKAEAQAEKERLAETEAAQAENPTPGREELPPADFKGLVGLLASQAIMGLGAMPDKSGKGVMIDLEGSKFAIDLLAMIEEKTSGNLDEEESKELGAVLTELRSRFVQITQLLAEQAAKPAKSEGAQPEAPKIIVPD
ncbi:MAG: DUF1844 domain-containing protein [Phycisphaerales bacterium]|jgi:hypothetical protein|nr:DUF1844 domain-containing protein [Phycisphaerales bacterium]